MRDVEGKVAVVTGAASGMGKAFSERFAQAGMKVVLADVEDRCARIRKGAEFFDRCFHRRYGTPPERNPNERACCSVRAACLRGASGAYLTVRKNA